nr:nuclear transport factor 2 family protein [Novosphingobium piscinae]
MLAEQACARLVADYANLNDCGDWDGVAGLYAEDARFARPSAPEDWIVGRAAILAALRARPPRRGRHLCSNVVITVESAQLARGTCAIGLFVEGQPPLVGSFHDRFVKIGPAWRFAERRGSLAY